jgi:hypothetical protein
VHIKRRLALAELGEEGNSRLQVLRAGAGVVLEVLEVADSCLLCDGLGFLLVLGELGIYS